LGRLAQVVRVLA